MCRFLRKNEFEENNIWHLTHSIKDDPAMKKSYLAINKNTSEETHTEPDVEVIN